LPLCRSRSRAAVQFAIGVYVNNKKLSESGRATANASEVKAMFGDGWPRHCCTRHHLFGNNLCGIQRLPRRCTDGSDTPVPVFTFAG
jgi:hypothetical protein